jgi:sulfoxide reductase catalytic subunit YedY
MQPTTESRMARKRIRFLLRRESDRRPPRGSHPKERRPGRIFKYNTLMFNGYADQVASLYAGMNLKKDY